MGPLCLHRPKAASLLTSQFLPTPTLASESSQLSSSQQGPGLWDKAPVCAEHRPPETALLQSTELGLNPGHLLLALSPRTSPSLSLLIYYLK